MAHTHLTTPTQHIDVEGTRLAYGCWGNPASAQPPLLMLQHFRGGMDPWDPLMTYGLAEGREVILFNGRGVASSGGAPRTRIEDMADDAAAFVRTLGLQRIDLLGFSLGVVQALDLTWRHPKLVRKLMAICTHTDCLGLWSGRLRQTRCISTGGPTHWLLCREAFSRVQAIHGVFLNRSARKSISSRTFGAMCFRLP